MASGVYIWSHPNSDKIYVGESLDIERRWRQELQVALSGSDRQPSFFNWIRKYWPTGDVERTVLEEVKEHHSKSVLKDKLLEMEEDWEEMLLGMGLTLLNNKKCGGPNTLLDEASLEKLSASIKLSHSRPEVKAKLSKAKKGQVPWSKGKTKANHPGLASQAEK